MIALIYVFRSIEWSIGYYSNETRGVQFKVIFRSTLRAVLAQVLAGGSDFSAVIF
ncbi:hypothetical protein PI23P_11052 [Polaribacter irgensii 23-P]|uniref:Uncharacterized protein n=1 Tax=Polaribacter irgensii 23-P TaxID=313594 RepID=A4C163_9FLAO|nr:hypothetical protein PI23P_11052 [Polaribacter irgensii 23-P]